MVSALSALREIGAGAFDVTERPRVAGSPGADGDNLQRDGARTAGTAGVSPPSNRPTVAFGAHLPSQADAAAKVQAIQRGRVVRQRTSTKMLAKEVPSKSAFGSHVPATPEPAVVKGGVATAAATGLSEAEAEEESLQVVRGGAAGAAGAAEVELSPSAATGGQPSADGRRLSEAEAEEELLQLLLLQGMAETDEAAAATMMQARQRGRMTRQSPARRVSAPAESAAAGAVAAGGAAAGGASGRGTAANGGACSSGAGSGGVGIDVADGGVVGLGAATGEAAGGSASGTGAASGSGAGAGRCGAAEAITQHAEEAGPWEAGARGAGANAAGPEEARAASRLQARQRGRAARRHPRGAPAAKEPALSAEEALAQPQPPSPSKARRECGSIGRYDATASGVPSSGLAASESGAARLEFEPSVRGCSASGRRIGAATAATAAGEEPSPSAATDEQPSADGRRPSHRGGRLHRGATFSACSAAESSAAAPSGVLGEAAPLSPPASRGGSPDARHRRSSTSTPSSQAREPVFVESAPSSQAAHAPPLERRASTLTLELGGGDGLDRAATRMQARQRGRIDRRQAEQKRQAEERQPRSQARATATDLALPAAPPEETRAAPSRAELVARAQAAASAQAAPAAPGVAGSASKAEAEAEAAAQQQQLAGRYEAGQLRLEKWIGAEEQRLVEQLQRLEAEAGAAADEGAMLQSASRASKHLPELPGKRSSAVLGQLGGARRPQPAPTPACGAAAPQSMQAAGANPSASAAALPADAAPQTKAGTGEGRLDPEGVQAEVQREVQIGVQTEVQSRASQQVPPVAAACGSGSAEAEAGAKAGAEPAAELTAEAAMETVAKLPAAEPTAEPVAGRHPNASPEQLARAAPGASPQSPPPQSPPTQLPPPVLAASAAPSAPPAPPAPPDAPPDAPLAPTDAPSAPTDAPSAPTDAPPEPPASPEVPVSPESPKAPQVPGDQSDQVDVQDVVAAVAALRVAGAVAVEATVEEWLRPHSGLPSASLLAKVGPWAPPQPRP